MTMIIDKGVISEGKNNIYFVVAQSRFYAIIACNRVILSSLKSTSWQIEMRGIIYALWKRSQGEAQ